MNFYAIGTLVETKLAHTKGLVTGVIVRDCNVIYLIGINPVEGGVPQEVNMFDFELIFPEDARRVTLLETAAE